MYYIVASKIKSYCRCYYHPYSPSAHSSLKFPGGGILAYYAGFQNNFKISCRVNHAFLCIIWKAIAFTSLSVSLLMYFNEFLRLYDNDRAPNPSNSVRIRSFTFGRLKTWFWCMNEWKFVHARPLEFIVRISQANANTWSVHMRQHLFMGRASPRGIYFGSPQCCCKGSSLQSTASW